MINAPVAVETVITMSSREIAELTGKRHFDVLRDITRMFEQLEEDSTGYAKTSVNQQNGQEYRYFDLDRRYVECLLTGYNVKLRMRVIDRLRELEAKKTPQLTPMEMIAAIATASAEQERRLNDVEQAINDIAKGTIPDGYQVFSYLSDKAGLTVQKCRDLVRAFGVPNKQVPCLGPGGGLVQMTVIDMRQFMAAYALMMEAVEKRGQFYYSEYIGRFILKQAI